MGGEQVTSGTIHDNPWAGVIVAPPEPSSSADDAANNNNNNTTTSPRPKTLTDWMLHTLVQICFTLDLCACILLLIYAASLSSCHSTHPNELWLVWWALEVALVVGVRILSVTAALYYSHLVHWTGFIVASYTCLILAVQFLAALIAVLARPVSSTNHLFPSCHNNNNNNNNNNNEHSNHNNKLVLWWTTQALSQCWETVKPWLWLILLIAVCLEFPVRWYLYRLYRFRLIWQQEQDEFIQPIRLDRQRRRGRPWWWSSSSLREQQQTGQQPDLETADAVSLRDALLDYDITDTPAEDSERPHRRRLLGTNGLPQWARERSTTPRPHQDTLSSSSSSWWAFWRSSSMMNDTYDPRDDGSVDFASVQEEWATRSEEDPLWWSRDNNNNNESNNNPQEAAGGASSRVPDYVQTTIPNNIPK